MDRRVKRSKNALMKAYISIAKKNPDKDPLIKDVCQAADVNKTTFYRHYTNLSELRIESEEYLAKEIIGDAVGLSIAFTDSERYIHWGLERFSRFQNEMMAFKHHPLEFLSVVQNVMFDAYQKRYNRQINPVVIDFITGGMVRVFMLSDGGQDEKNVKIVAKIIDAVMSADSKVRLIKE